MFTLPRLASPATALAVAALAPALLTATATAAPTPVPTTQCDRQWQTSETEINLPLVDRLGYAFETVGYDDYYLVEGRPTGYGGLQEGFTTASDDERWASTGLPTHGTESGDAFDGWGQLFVGGPGVAQQYSDDNKQGCSLSADGRALVHAEKTIAGLRVQRTVSIPDATLGGARFVDTLHNPTAAPITTEVQVGDLAVGQFYGSLGSDDGTAVAASSSGDAAASAEDSWFVTTDGVTSGSDPAIAFVSGAAAGARDPLAFAVVGAEVPRVGEDGPWLDADQVGYGWKSVTIAPGETATFATWTLLRTVPGKVASEQGVLAAAAAKALQDGPLSEVFAGMTAEQIAGVRNWPRPKPAGVTLTVTGQPTAGQTLTFTAAVSDAAGGVPVCGAATTLWQFPDGTTETGLTVSRALAAGDATVKATTVNACGGRTDAALQVAVAAAPAVTPGPAPQPAPAAAPPFQAQAPKAAGRRSLLSNGLQLTTTSAQPGRLRIVLQGKGLKIVKTATFKKPVTKRKVKVKVARRHRAALRRLKQLKLITTFTGADGTITRSSRQLRLK